MISEDQLISYVERTLRRKLPKGVSVDEALSLLNQYVHGLRSQVARLRKKHVKEERQ